MKQKKQNIAQLNTGFQETTKKGLIIVVCIVIFLGFMYFLTTRILKKEQTKKQEIESIIQYDKILAGESFNQQEEEYYVIYYDSSDQYSIFDSTISSYQANVDKIRLYSVDLADGMNQKYITDSEINVNSPSELKIKYPTLLHFKSGQVEEIITDLDKINEYLSEE